MLDHAKRHRVPLKMTALLTSSLKLSPAIVRNANVFRPPIFVSICLCEYYLTAYSTQIPLVFEIDVYQKTSLSTLR